MRKKEGKNDWFDRHCCTGIFKEKNGGIKLWIFGTWSSSIGQKMGKSVLICLWLSKYKWWGKWVGTMYTDEQNLKTHLLATELRLLSKS